MAAIIVALMRASKQRQAEEESSPPTLRSVTSPRDYKRQQSFRALKRKQLLERLLLEQKLAFGMLQLVLWGCAFLFMYFLGFDSASSESKLGIRTMISQHFDLDSVGDVVDMQGLMEFIQNYNEKSRDFAIDGNPYFPDTAQLQLVEEATTFTEPTPLSSRIDPRLTQHFSIVGWVKAEEVDSKGYILRKYIPGSDTSCWAWKYPGEFRFGTHDFGLERLHREHVLYGAGGPPATSLLLEALVVNGSHALFYSERRAGGLHRPTVRALPRTVTDCKGMLAVGDEGLTIGDLRVYPYALTGYQLDEIHMEGSTLEDLIMSTIPTHPATTDTDVILHRLRSMEHELYEEIKTDFTQLQLRNIRERILREAAAPAAAPDAPPGAPARGLRRGLNVSCVVGSPCRVEVADPGTPLPNASGLTLVPDTAVACEGPFLVSPRYTDGQGLGNPTRARPPCGSGPACVGQLRARGILAVGAHALDLGIPTAGAAGTRWHLCWSPDLANGTHAVVHVGALAVDAYAGHVQIQPDAQLGPAWHTFPRPLYHTRARATGTAFSLAFWAYLKPGEGTLEQGHEVAMAMSRMTAGLDHFGLLCWTAKVYKHKLVYEGAAHTAAGLEQAECHIPAFYQLSQPERRHVAFVWGPPATLTMYLDGERLCSFDHLHHTTAQLHCPDPHDYFMTFNSGEWLEHHTHLPKHGAYELGADIYESLFYPDTALTAEEVRELSTHAEKECHNIDHVYDTLYTDAAGHGCDWYQVQISEGSDAKSTCDAAARAACPLACNVASLCFPGEGTGSVHHTEGKKHLVEVSVEKEKPYVLWDRVRKVGPETLCPADALEKGKGIDGLMAECAAGHRATGHDRWEDIHKVGQTAYAPNITDCPTLRRWYTPECAFDGNVTRRWAEEVTRTQEFTIMFWAKGPVYLHLLNQVYPPVGLAAFTLGEDRRFTVQTLTTANGDPACAGASAYYTHGYSAGHSTTTEWEFYAFQVYHDPEEGVSARMFTQGTVAYGGWPLGRLCVADIEGLLFESAKGALVSPISLYPHAMPLSDIFLHYYQQIGFYRLHTPGPLRADNVQNARIQRDTPPYPYWTFSITPALLFSERFEPKACEGVSHAVLEHLAEEAFLKCGGRYQCDVDYHDHPELLFPCRDEARRPATFMAKERSPKGFVEILGMLDNPLIRRADTLFSPKSFIDTLTETVEITQLYLTPSWPGGLKNTLTIVDLTFTVRYGITGEVHIQTIPVFDAAKLQGKFPMMVGALVALGLLLLYSLFLLLCRIRHRPEYHAAPSVLNSVLDLLLIVACALYTVFYWSAIAQSEESIGSHVETLTGIEWLNRASDFGRKVQLFFQELGLLEGQAAYMNQLSTAAQILMFLMLIRLVAALSVHPRVSLITGTLMNSGDDLAHFVFLFLVKFVTLSAIGTWAFGADYPEYRTLGTTFMTQWVNLIGGSVPGGYETDWRLGLYGFIFIIIGFLMLLNFLLAIIVEAYMKVRESIEAQETENSLPVDITILLATSWLGLRHRWPSRTAICHALVTMDEPAELVCADDIPAFAAPGAWAKFWAFYSAFDWALPPADTSPAFTKVHAVHPQPAAQSEVSDTPRGTAGPPEVISVCHNTDALGETPVEEDPASAAAPVSPARSGYNTVLHVNTSVRGVRERVGDVKLPQRPMSGPQRPMSGRNV